MSIFHTASGGPSGGRVEDPGDFTLEAGLCRPTPADGSALGGLMGHLVSSSQRSSVKDLGLELADRPAIRAIGVAGSTYLFMLIYTYIYIRRYI